MVNSLPDDSLIPIIIFAVTCSLTYLMPVALSISVMFSRMALISSRVISGRGSLMAGFLLLSIAFYFLLLGQAMESPGTGARRLDS